MYWFETKFILIWHLLSRWLAECLSIIPWKINRSQHLAADSLATRAPCAGKATKRLYIFGPRLMALPEAKSPSYRVTCKTTRPHQPVFLQVPIICLSIKFTVTLGRFRFKLILSFKQHVINIPLEGGCNYLCNVFFHVIISNMKTVNPIYLIRCCPIYLSNIVHLYFKMKHFKYVFALALNLSLRKTKKFPSISVIGQHF